MSVSSVLSPLLFPLSDCGSFVLSTPSSVIFLSFSFFLFQGPDPCPFLSFHSCSSLFYSSSCSFCPFVLLVCFTVFFPSPSSSSSSRFSSSFCSLFSSYSSFFGSLSSFLFLRLLLPSLLLLFLFVCAFLSSSGSLSLSPPPSSVVLFLSFLSSSFGVYDPCCFLPFLSTPLPTFSFPLAVPFVLFVCFAVFFPSPSYSSWFSCSFCFLFLLLLLFISDPHRGWYMGLRAFNFFFFFFFRHDFWNRYSQRLQI